VSTNDIEVGDVVRIGKGKRLWRVEGFGTYGVYSRQKYVALEPLDGYTKASADPDRLTVVTKAGEPS